MLGSILAGARFSFAGMLGRCSGLTRLGDCLTVMLVLFITSQSKSPRAAGRGIYVETSPGLVFPVINFSQASAHSRTISDAYLDGRELDFINRLQQTYFLFLHSPVKANWFSGFPSGIL